MYAVCTHTHTPPSFAQILHLSSIVIPQKKATHPPAHPRPAAQSHSIPFDAYTPHTITVPMFGTSVRHYCISCNPSQLEQTYEYQPPSHKQCPVLPPRTLARVHPSVVRMYDCVVT